jgi:hypothetical protein
VGLVLLAALAQAVALLGVRDLMEEEARARMDAAEAALASETVDQGGDVDLGVVVERGAAEDVEVEVESVETKPERKKIKRRKRNVIDDLFDELG